jgi:glutamate/tyrosine decarboxylase-like PLP-dependent enzyme
MTATTTPQSEQWSRVMGRAATLAGEYIAELLHRPVGPLVSPQELRRMLGGPLPRDPEDAVDVVSHLGRVGHLGTTASAGPRFFGFVMGGAVPAAAGADWLVTAWDQNAAGYGPSPMASIVEEVAAGWVLELLGLPSQCSVGFVTGGTMATFTAFAAARHLLLTRDGWDVEARGLRDAPAIAVVATREYHPSLERAVRLLGIGTDAIHIVSTDGNGAIEPDDLAATLESIQTPTIVFAQAGNINTGAVDPLDRICDITRSHNAWVHVDGAVGLWALASPSFRPRFAGIDRADSWSTDAHKWLNVPFDCGVVICAHSNAHRAALNVTGPYIVPTAEREGYDWTPEWSRRARALPLYAAIRSLGQTGIADLVERCCTLAQRFAQNLGAVRGIHVLNDVVLNQVLVAFDSPDDDQDSLADETVDRVQKDGTCWLFGTTWHGRRAMRISVCNWTTTDNDVDRSTAAIARAYGEAVKARSRVR